MIGKYFCEMCCRHYSLDDMFFDINGPMCRHCIKLQEQKPMITTCVKHNCEYVEAYCPKCIVDSINKKPDDPIFSFCRMHGAYLTGMNCVKCESIKEEPKSDWVEFSRITDNKKIAFKPSDYKIFICENENGVEINLISNNSAHVNYVSVVKETLAEVMEKIK